MTKEALKMALEALEEPKEHFAKHRRLEAITAIKEALAQPEQEPVAWMDKDGDVLSASIVDGKGLRNIPLYTTPPQPKEPEQEPVAMKFKIYKPTVPDPLRQGINNALLPWVYDQDRSSGFDATMWVTPVATLPPQRTWVGLTDDEIAEIENEYIVDYRIPAGSAWNFAKDIETKLKQKNTKGQE